MNTNGEGNPKRKLDEIGEWSVDKLNILKAYSEQYALILQKQKIRLRYGYIDAFAGAGEHVLKKTGATVPGSPMNALAVRPSFDEYHFIDLNPERVRGLIQMCEGKKNVQVHEGNCNEVLLKKVFPKFRFEDYARALCFLDPYGLQLRWDVLAAAGKMGTIEIFLNFPIMDINRNAKKRRIEDVDPDDRARMTAFWGDEGWHKKMFEVSAQGSLFDLLGQEPDLEKTGNDAFASAFQMRLKEVAGFKYVPKPVPMRNSKKAVVYYLFFAGNNETGSKISSHIFNQYRKP